MKQRITIAGLGSGGEDDITLGVLKSLEKADRVILKTEKHGIVPFLRERGIEFTALDHICDGEESPEEALKAMVRAVADAAEEGGVVVGVPGHPLDDPLALELIKELEGPACRIDILPGHGSADSLYFHHLTAIMEKLRSPGGCPWDREQDHRTLKQYLIEEAYEVLEAIDLNDVDKLTEELGDVLLQVVFHAQIAKENGEFDIRDVIAGICRKLIDRHPHIFGDKKVKDSVEVAGNWEAIKKAEKGFTNYAQVLKAIPSNLPALMRAYKVQQKAALVGFDWDRWEDAMAKLEEELAELKAACRSGGEEEIHEEMGDLLFAVVNVCRFLSVQPELCLKAATDKFIRRFEYMEELADRPLEEMALSELDTLWNRAKLAFHRHEDV